MDNNLSKTKNVEKDKRAYGGQSDKTCYIQTNQQMCPKALQFYALVS